MENKEKTSAEIAAERIANMPIHENYKPVDDLPIPLHKGVLVQKARLFNPVLPATTAGGILIPETAEENRNPDKTGIIFAVGPECSKMVKVGLMCQFNHFVDSYFFHKGETYFKMHENDVYYIVPSNETTVHNGAKSSAAIRREGKFQEQKQQIIHESKQDANEKDKRLDKTKGKIRVMKTK